MKPCMVCGGEAKYKLRAPEGIRCWCQAHWDERQRDRDERLMNLARTRGKA